MRRFLVVANQTLGSAALERHLKERAAEGPCRFHVVVPATRPKDHLTWTEGAARALAQERLDRALGWFADHGFSSTGEVGDERPMLAIEDAVRESGPFDEIILSTLAAGASAWLKQDLPHKVQRNFGLPVSHVTAHAEQPPAIKP